MLLSQRSYQEETRVMQQCTSKNKTKNKTKSVLVEEVGRTITSSQFGWLRLYYAELYRGGGGGGGGTKKQNKTKTGYKNDG